MSKSVLPKNMRVYISKNDICHSKKKCSINCPLALSINRRLPKNYIVSVCGDVIITNTRGRTFTYSISESTIDAIMKYDKTGDFTPRHVRLTQI